MYEELYAVGKGVESDLECWEEIVIYCYRKSSKNELK
jgi:hypothetical protein